MSEPAAASHRPDASANQAANDSRAPEPAAGQPPTPDASAPRFTPVPVRPRRDGWTVEKQRIFIRTLAETGLVTRAARAAGMSARSAHRLALRDDAESFCQAWDAAFRLATRRGVSRLFEYGLDGMTETVWRDGEIAYRRRRPSEKALIFLLTRIDPARFAAPAAAAAAPRGFDGEPADPVGQTAADFDLYLQGLEDLPPEEGEEEADAADAAEDEGGE